MVPASIQTFVSFWLSWTGRGCGWLEELNSKERMALTGRAAGKEDGAPGAQPNDLVQRGAEEEPVTASWMPFQEHGGNWLYRYAISWADRTWGTSPVPGIQTANARREFIFWPENSENKALKGRTICILPRLPLTFHLEAPGSKDTSVKAPGWMKKAFVHYPCRYSEELTGKLQWEDSISSQPGCGGASAMITSNKSASCV